MGGYNSLPSARHFKRPYRSPSHILPTTDTMCKILHTILQFHNFMIFTYPFSLFLCWCWIFCFTFFCFCCCFCCWCCCCCCCRVFFFSWWLGWSHTPVCHDRNCSIIPWVSSMGYVCIWRCCMWCSSCCSSWCSSCWKWACQYSNICWIADTIFNKSSQQKNYALSSQKLKTMDKKNWHQTLWSTL